VTQDEDLTRFATDEEFQDFQKTGSLNPSPETPMSSIWGSGRKYFTRNPEKWEKFARDSNHGRRPHKFVVKRSSSLWHDDPYDRGSSVYTTEKIPRSRISSWD